MNRSWNSISFISITLAILFFLFFNFGDVFAALNRHLCHPEQRDAVLKFKNEFEIQKRCFDRPLKTDSWANHSDCCSWDGIRCDAKFGDVIKLNLSYSCLHGKLNTKSNIFRLQNLRHLDLSNNDISGQIPYSFANLFSLTILDLSVNNFVGEIPSLLGNLSHLTVLGLGANSLVGEIPSSIGNLSHLTTLVLCENNFVGEIPSSFENLLNLTFLDLSQNNLVGELPSFFGRLNQLVILSIENNKFSGNLPRILLNLTNLSELSVSLNHFTGTFPHNMSSLSKLEFFYAEDNTFTGNLPSSLLTIPSLTYISLKGNQLNGTLEFGNISSSSKLESLDLGNNNFIGPIPKSISKLVNLNTLYLSNNKIKGEVPASLWMLADLEYVNLSNNTFTGFKRSTKPGISPVQRKPLKYLFGANNNFTGNIPSFICGFRSLIILDLSNNKFDGSIPLWMGNFSSTLQAIHLRNNRLTGGLPKNISESVKSLDIGHNQLEGKLPRSFARISFLEVLNVESNRINDMFPFWLSSLKELQVLVLRSNAFHGPIQQTGFSKLRIIDISSNHFYGTFPSDFFVNWTAMCSLEKDEDQFNGEYMGTSYYSDSIVLMNKGLEMELERILKIYTAIDFSGNKFEGEIPRSVGILKELHVLNFSNNAFTGHIPSSMANLGELESLDISQNKLSGEIPQELGNLSYLAYMNFSHNQLVGLVPGGTQFKTQPCSSFKENLGLYGPSLDEICLDIHVKTSHQSVKPEQEEDEDEEELISWIAAAIGFLPGIAFGLMMGYIFVCYKPEWFMNPFGKKNRRRA